MIYFLLKRAYRSCLASLETFSYELPAFVILPYEDLFVASHVTPGTYVFCDLERLSDFGLAAAAEIAALMKGATGFCVLNDPARCRTRFGFLRAMREAGLNDFDAYRADGLPKPKRFPVFIREEADHTASISGLLPDQALLDAELERLSSAAQPLRGLIVIEYCGEEVSQGVWRRFGTFRIGQFYHLHDVVSEDNWNVKYGRKGLVDEATYEEDLRRMESGFMIEELRRAFEIAEIDYGRADFGLVAGRPQVYEINTNPHISGSTTHPSPTRIKSYDLARQLFARNLRALAMENSGDGHAPVRLEGVAISRLRAEGANAQAPPFWRRLLRSKANAAR